MATALAYGLVGLLAIVVFLLEWGRERRSIRDALGLGPVPNRLDECPVLAAKREAAIQYVSDNNLEPCYSDKYRRRMQRAEREKKRRYAEIGARAKARADESREYAQMLRDWEPDDERIS